MTSAIKELTGLTITEEPDSRKIPTMVTDADGIPQTPETTLIFICRGWLLPALDYIKVLTDPGVKTILSMLAMDAAIIRGFLEMAMEVASLIDMKLTDRELMLIFQVNLEVKNWDSCLDCLALFKSQEYRGRALDQLI